jgi:hypothetical protein
VKLYMSTPSGLGLGLSIHLTGRLRVNEREQISGVEIYMPLASVILSDHFIDAGGGDGRQVLWVEPGDLRCDEGPHITQIEIHAAATSAKEKLRAEILRGPLGEDWP